MIYGNNYYRQPQYMGYQPQQQQPQPQPTLQIQNGGFVPVQNEMEARNYLVAYGNSITFKDENAPYVYVKTMGFSQLDRPIFEKYRLVKEEDTSVASPEPRTATPSQQTINPIPNEDLAGIRARIKALEAIVKQLTAVKGDENNE